MPALSPLAWVLVVVVVALGSALQGSIGFGMNVLAAPIVVHVERDLVPGPLLVAAGVLTLAVAVRERRDLAVRELGWAVLGRLPGVALGAVAVAAIGADGLAVVLGLSVLAGVVVSVSGVDVPVTPATLLGAGLLSGFMGTSTSVGGPPMALLFQRRQGPSIRANLSGFFLLGVLVSIGALAAAGEFAREELLLSLPMVPAVLVGFAVSGWARTHVDRRTVRPAVLAISTVSALGLLVRTVVQ